MNAHTANEPDMIILLITPNDESLPSRRVDITDAIKDSIASSYNNELDEETAILCMIEDLCDANPGSEIHLLVNA
jgi:hypothetical protein